MIEIHEGRYVSAIWFVQGVDQDFLGALWRDEGENFIFDFRVRNYADNLIGSKSKDKLTPYRVEFLDGDSESFAVGVVGKIVSSLKFLDFTAYDPPEMIVVKSDSPIEIVELLAMQPWAHTGFVGAAEA